MTRYWMFNLNDNLSNEFSDSINLPVKKTLAVNYSQKVKMLKDFGILVCSGSSFIENDINDLKQVPNFIQYFAQLKKGDYIIAPLQDDNPHPNYNKSLICQVSSKVYYNKLDDKGNNEAQDNLIQDSLFDYELSDDLLIPTYLKEASADDKRFETDVLEVAMFCYVEVLKEVITNYYMLELNQDEIIYPSYQGEKIIKHALC